MMAAASACHSLIEHKSQIKLTHRFVFVYNSWLAAYTVIISLQFISQFIRLNELNAEIEWRMGWFRTVIISFILIPFNFAKSIHGV